MLTKLFSLVTAKGSMSGQRVAQSKKRSVSDFCSSFGLDISLVSLFFCIIGRAQTYTFSFLFFSFPNAAAFDAFDEKMRDPIVAFVDDSFWVGSLTLIPIILLFTFYDNLSLRKRNAPSSATRLSRNRRRRRRRRARASFRTTWKTSSLSS